MLSEPIHTHAPLFPPALLLLLLLAALGVTVFSYARLTRLPLVRRAPALLLRLLALGLLAWLLAGPAWFEADESAQHQPRLAILADTSASMSEPDVALTGRDEPLTRWNALRRTWLAPDHLDALDEAARLSLHAFDADLRPLDPDALPPRVDGDETRLYEAIRHAADQAGQGGDVLVLSDGHDTTARPPADLPADLRRRDVRLLAVPLGQPAPGPRLVLDAWAEHERLFPDQPARLHAALRHHHLAGREVELILRKQGQPIARERLTLDESPATRHTFTSRPDPPDSRDTHVRRYTLEARLLEQPDDLAPPPRDVFIEIADEPLRLALLEGQPHWESRFLIRLIQNQPRLELHALQHVAPGRRISTTPPDAEPLEPRTFIGRLDEFDVLILGRRVDRLIDPGEAAAILDFLRQGGSLLLARGRPWPEAGPLDALLPDDVASLPDTGPPDPAEAIVHTRVGQGRLVLVHARDIWRYAMQPDQPAYHAFWNHALARLAPDGWQAHDRPTLRLDRLAPEPGDTVRARLRFPQPPPPDLQPQLRHLRPDGSQTRLALQPDADAPGQFIATITPGQAGPHILTAEAETIDPDDPPRAGFALADRSPEGRDTRARPDHLARLAEQTGGRAFDLGEPEHLLQHLRDLAETRAGQQLRRHSPGHTWPILALVALALAAEWALRRT